MGIRPRFPTLAIAAWLAFVADLGGTAALLSSDAPLTLKIGVSGLSAVGLYTIVVVYLTRRHDSRRPPDDEP